MRGGGGGAQPQTCQGDPARDAAEAGQLGKPTPRCAWPLTEELSPLAAATAEKPPGSGHGCQKALLGACAGQAPWKGCWPPAPPPSLWILSHLCCPGRWQGRQTGLPPHRKQIRLCLVGTHQLPPQASRELLTARTCRPARGALDQDRPEVNLQWLWGLRLAGARERCQVQTDLLTTQTYHPFLQPWESALLPAARGPAPRAPLLGQPESPSRGGIRALLSWLRS